MRVLLLVGVALALSFATARAAPPSCLHDSPLHLAVAHNDVKEILALLHLEPGLRLEPNALGELPLHQAARGGNVAVVRALLRGVTADLEGRDYWEATPLLRALWAGREAAARILLAAGADPRAASRDGVTVLHAAARRGLSGMLAPLLNALAKGASGPAGRNAFLWAALASEDEAGLTPLDHAALAGSRPALQALLALGARVHHETLVAACGLSRVDTARYLAARMKAPRPLQGALELALSGDGPLDAHAAICLVHAGAVPDAAAVRAALLRGRRELAAFFALARRGDGELGDSMLPAAPEAGDVGLVRLLVTLGESVAAVDAEGATPLHRAILADKVEAALALLALGADARADFAGVSARGLALRQGSLAVVRALSDVLGRDVSAAAALDEVETLRRLLAADGEAAMRVGEDGLLPLHLAARFGARGSVALLIAAGVPVDAPVAQGVRWRERDLSGWTALHFAAQYGHAAIFDWLLAAGARDGLAADGLSAKARASSALSGREGDGSWQSKGLEDADLPAGDQVSAPHARVIIGAGGMGHGSRPSFIGMGGGLFRDERRAEEEVVPPSLLVAAEPESDAAGWSAALAACMAAEDWPEAERVARDLVAARGRAPLPAFAGGYGWHGQRLLSAAASQSLGRVLIERGRMSEAQASFAAAHKALAPLELPREATQMLPEHRVQLALALGVARLHARMRELERAEAVLTRALASAGGEVLAPLRAGVLVRLGLVLGEAASYAPAIARMREALALIEAHDESDEMPSVHVARYNLSTLLGRAGERKEARAIIEKELARVLSGDVTEAEDWGMIRYAAGIWRMVDGAHDTGEALITSARDGLEAAYPSHPMLGRFDLGLGLAYTQQGRLAEAAFVLERGRDALLASEGVAAVDSLSPATAVEVARIDGAHAAVLRRGERLDEALQLARGAYATVVGAEALEARWPLELELARIEAARGHLAVAIFFGKRAVRTLDRIRHKGLPEGLEVEFIADRLDAWRELADHLIQAGRFLEATAALAAIKEDEGEAMTMRGGRVGKTTPAAATRPKSPLPEIGAEAQSERRDKPLEAAQSELDRLVGGGGGKEPSEPELWRIEQARKTLREKRRLFEGWLQALESELGKLPPARARAIAAMNLRDLAGLQGTLGELGPGVVMLHYLMTAERVRIIVTTPTGQVGREALVPEGDLNSLVFQFRQVLADPRLDASSAGKALYDILIAPVAADLAEAKAETLLVSLDGPLRYAPLAALWDGEGWLIERYRVVHFARAALDKIMSARPAVEALAAFGCGRPVPGYQELTAVPSELEGIVKRDEHDPDGELPGVVKLDDAFSRESLTSLLEAKRYSAVHIASHFVLGPGGEAESYLLLGDGSRFTLEDMRYDLRFDGVDLLSLSACNTAVGEDAGDGRELEGFASLALRLGARAVLATLWPVNDASTGLFMRTLYRLIRADPKLSRAEVLRHAMLAFIRGEVSLPAGEAARGPRPLAGPSAAAGSEAHAAPPAAIDLRHPRYWAPFVFIGNWR